MCTYTYKHIHTYAYIYIHTNMHAHTYNARTHPTRTHHTYTHTHTSSLCLPACQSAQTRHMVQSVDSVPLLSQNARKKTDRQTTMFPCKPTWDTAKPSLGRPRVPSAPSFPTSLLSRATLLPAAASPSQPQLRVPGTPASSGRRKEEARGRCRDFLSLGQADQLLHWL